jgi:nicotinate phosphoribosyltransferase
LKHYTDFGINPKDKTLIYSDGLDCNRVNELYDAYKDKIKVEFGVGSNLSCIMDNPLKIVIKMHMFDGKDVKKISDDPRKAT